MTRDEYEGAIRVAIDDLVSCCEQANFVEISQFIETSARYIVELAKRWDFDRDQARHKAHGREGKRLPIKKAVAEATAATKRHFRDEAYKEWEDRYGPPPEKEEEPKPDDAGDPTGEKTTSSSEEPSSSSDPELSNLPSSEQPSPSPPETTPQGPSSSSSSEPQDDPEKPPSQPRPSSPAERR